MTRAEKIQAGIFESAASRYLDHIPTEQQPLLTDCITDTSTDINGYFWTDVKALFDQRLPRFLELIQE